MDRARSKPRRRLSASIDSFNLSADLRFHQDYRSIGGRPPPEVRLGLIGSGRVGDIRLRGQVDFDVKPGGRFRGADLSAYWSASERSDWEGGFAYDGLERRARARLTHIIRLDSFALALTGEAASDGSVAAGFNLSFSLDPRHGFTLSRRPLAEGGMVHATVFRDLNDNGILDAGEPLQKGALITTGARQVERTTDAKGSVIVGGLTPYMPIPVGLDATSLEDPMLVPKKPIQVVVPRPGVAADVQIALVGGGDIEGALIKNGEQGFEGVDVELVDPPARRSRPPARISTASSCSNAWPMAAMRCGSALIRRGGQDRSRPRRRAQCQRRKSRSSGWAPSTHGCRPHRVRGTRQSRPPPERAQLDWCGREDSNFHGLSATATSTLRVYQFRHDRTPWITAR